MSGNVPHTVVSCICGKAFHSQKELRFHQMLMTFKYVKSKVMICQLEKVSPDRAVLKL